ncbi:hypothetical protein B296_00033728 [Ensete ventricosum]|uniref:Uncharacterized protein n=1 Tax=Ensete ventricosum TaxID=4639 RepID=A0A426ZWI3_ENSVE|nr:hypothetical protein B296_00033728 [Ensete ventricosum]
MKGVDIKDGIWSDGTKFSLDRGQGHEFLQRQEQDHIIPWVFHSDGVDSSSMVPKTKGASRHMHFILEKHLIKGLSAAILVVMKKAVRSKDSADGGIKAQDPDNGAPISAKSVDFESY